MNDSNGDDDEENGEQKEEDGARDGPDERLRDKEIDSSKQSL